MMKERVRVPLVAPWKYVLVLLVFLLGVLYSVPNLFPERPTVQVSSSPGHVMDDAWLSRLEQVLADKNIVPQSIKREAHGVMFVFRDTQEQLTAQHVMQTYLGDRATAALNLATATPAWLRALHAEPMRLGLDLRGGVHFLLSVDVDTALRKRLDVDLRSLMDAMRQEKIRYTGAITQPPASVRLRFRDQETSARAKTALARFLVSDWVWQEEPSPQGVAVLLSRTEVGLQQQTQQVMEQTITVLRNRVNELGVAEPLVQQQGRDRIAVDLPGIQDAVLAKQIIGGTATIELYLVQDAENTAKTASSFGTRTVRTLEGAPLLVRLPAVLNGSSIVHASSQYDESGRPSVSVAISGPSVSYFSRVTGDNVGHRMAIVYTETKIDMQAKVSNQQQRPTRKVEYVLSAPVIQSALGNQFQITGLHTHEEAKNLGITLRAGALPAAIGFVEETTVGPSLGRDNIKKGVFSVMVGFFCVVFFMVLYYRLMGVIANIALAFNLVLLLAVLSMLGATLTLPGMAAIVLTVGMAVDANVLIFERIREELRLGVSPLASIHAGFTRAYATIVDANLTTLIVTLVLFSVGTGVIKGFAVIMMMGVATSMFTTVTFTHMLVLGWYGRGSVKRLSIGI